MSKISYLVDLAQLKFDEVTDTSAASWIMAMPLGNYHHPSYGKINITPERVQQFAANVNNKVRETELDIDYDHKEYGGEAAGWVKQAEPRSDGLWILVEWTKKAYEAIQSKAYRYFSPEFDDTWIHPRTGEKFKDVLFGGGITNRPFLKGIQPLNLSEDFYKTGEITLKEHKNMDPEQIKALATQLGLSEDATSEMVYGALQMKLAAPAGPPAGNENGTEGENESESTNESETQTVTAQLADLANNPLVKKLTERLEAQSKTLSEMVTAGRIKKLSDTAAEKGRELTPVVEAGVKKLLSESPSDEYSDTIIKTLSELISEVGPISGESGGGHKRLHESEDNAKKFSDKVTKYMSEQKVDFATAAVAVASEDAEGYDAYRAETYIQDGE